MISSGKKICAQQLAIIPCFQRVFCSATTHRLKDAAKDLQCKKNRQSLVGEKTGKALLSSETQAKPCEHSDIVSQIHWQGETKKACYRFHGCLNARETHRNNIDFEMQSNHKYVSQILIHVNKPNPFVLLTNTTGPTTSNHSTSKLPTSWGKPPTMNSEEQASYLCTSLSMQRTTQTNNYEILFLNYPGQATGSKHWKANLLLVCPSLCTQLHRCDCTLLSLQKTLSNQTSITKKMKSIPSVYRIKTNHFEVLTNSFIDLLAHWILSTNIN